MTHCKYKHSETEIYDVCECQCKEMLNFMVSEVTTVSEIKLLWMLLSQGNKYHDFAAAK
jgi:hypothetical protein